MHTNIHTRWYIILAHFLIGSLFIFLVAVDGPEFLKVVSGVMFIVAMLIRAIVYAKYDTDFVAFLGANLLGATALYNDLWWLYIIIILASLWAIRTDFVRKNKPAI